MYGFFYVFLRFFQNPKKHDFLRFFELLHTFSRTVFFCRVLHLDRYLIIVSRPTKMASLVVDFL